MSSGPYKVRRHGKFDTREYEVVGPAVDSYWFGMRESAKETADRQNAIYDHGFRCGAMGAEDEAARLRSRVEMLEILVRRSDLSGSLDQPHQLAFVDSDATADIKATMETTNQTPAVRGGGE